MGAANLTEIKYYCNECDDRTCTATTSKKPPAGSPQTCLWSNTKGFLIFANWATRLSPADIKPKKESESDGTKE